jgi:methylamine dehydrogenase accessory protein MauD
MTGALIASNILLWILVVGLIGLVFALMRQIGVLHERIAPAGALVGASGPVVGDKAPILELETWSGEPVRVGGRMTGPRSSTSASDASRDIGASTLLLFVSPTCPVCKTLLPLLDSLRRSEGGSLRVVLASDGPRAEHEAFVAKFGLADETYVLSQELGLRYAVEKLPTAYLIDAEGIVKAKGLVNSREHLESLFEASERGVASIQEFMNASVAAERGARHVA